MNLNELINQVAATQLSARALDAQCEVLLTELHKAKQDARRAAEQQKGCPHPPEYRRPAGTMGHSRRFQCGVCMEIVDPELQEATA